MKRTAAALLLLCLIALPLQSARATFAGRPGKIAFARSGAKPGIYTVRGDGTGLRRLTRSNDMAPSWSPDGRMIAFVRGGGVGPTRLMLMDSDGTDVHRLGAASRGFAEGCALQSPHWSYDGLFIVYADDCFDAEPRVAQIRVVSVADGSEIETTDYSSLNHLGSQPWSPDLENSTQIVFTSDRDGDSEVFVSNPDGTELRQLTEDTDDDIPAGWSPDGSSIAFTKQAVDEENDTASTTIWTVAPDGGDPDLKVTGRPHATYPVWAPSGGSFLFARQTETGVPTATIYDLATGEEKALGGFHPVDATWSPNERAIVYVRGGNLIKYRLSDGIRNRLTSGRAIDSQPDWGSAPPR